MHLIVSRKISNEREMTLGIFYFSRNVDNQSDPNIQLHTCEPVLPFPLIWFCRGLFLSCESQFVNYLELVSLRSVQLTSDRLIIPDICGSCWAFGTAFRQV